MGAQDALLETVETQDAQVAAADDGAPGGEATEQVPQEAGQGVEVQDSVPKAKRTKRQDINIPISVIARASEEIERTLEKTVFDNIKFADCGYTSIGMMEPPGHRKPFLVATKTLAGTSVRLNLLGSVSHVAKVGSFLIAKCKELGDVSFYLTPNTDVDGGFFMPGGLIPKTTKDDYNMITNTFPLAVDAVDYQFKANLLSEPTHVRIQLQVPFLSVRPQSQFERGTPLKRSSSDAEFTGNASESFEEFKKKVKKFKASLHRISGWSSHHCQR